MSTAASASGARRRAMARGIDRRQVALDIDDDVVAPVRVDACHAPRGSGPSRRRDRPGSSPPRRRPPAPPRRSPGASVATTTRPIPASTARRQTCTIIGSPADIGERLVRQAG